MKTGGCWSGQALLLPHVRRDGPGGFACGDVVFFSSRGRHTRSYGDWSSDVCFPISIKSFSLLPASSGLNRARSNSREKDFIATANPRSPGFATRRWVLRSEERRVGKGWRAQRGRCSEWNEDRGMLVWTGPATTARETRRPRGVRLWRCCFFFKQRTAYEIVR